jgi:hypothetical protein
LAKFTPIAVRNRQRDPAKFAALQRTFVHGCMLMLGGGYAGQPSRRDLMSNPNERNPNQQQQNTPRPGQGGQQQGGGGQQKPGQQQQGGGQQKPGQQSQQPGQGGQHDRDR